MSRSTTWFCLCALGLLSLVLFWGHGPVVPGAVAWTGRLVVWFGSWALALLAGPLLLLGIFAAGPPDRHGSVLGIAVLGLAGLAVCATAIVNLPFAVGLF